MKLILNKPDSLGALSSALCLIHCVATPFIFIVQSCSITSCEAAPTWWRFIDYFFLVISFYAIYKSAKTATTNFVKHGLWASWALLALIICNESLHVVSIPHYLIYFPALSLIGFHIYNLKYCRCKNDTCCV